MIRVLFRKEIINFIKYHLIFFAFVSTLLLFILNSVFSSGEEVYSVLEFLLVGFGVSYTTALYRKYSEDNYLKIIQAHGKSKSKVKITLFFVVIVWLLVLTITYLVLFVIYDYSGLLKHQNAFGNGGLPIWRLDNWQINHKSGFWFGFYAIVITIFMIVFYSALLNHFIKNKILILGINLLIIIYMLVFGGLLGFTQGVSDSKLNSKEYNWRTTLNFIIIPWTQVGVMAKVGWYAGLASNPNTSYLSYENVNFWDYSEMGSYSVLYWTPFLTIFVLASTPIIIKS